MFLTHVYVMPLAGHTSASLSARSTQITAAMDAPRVVTALGVTTTAGTRISTDSTMERSRRNSPGDHGTAENTASRGHK